MPRFREPKVCMGCSTDTAVKEYEGVINGNYVVKDPKKIKDLIVMVRQDEFSWICKKCARGRAVETTIALWWIWCNEHGKCVSPDNKICPYCESKDKSIKESREKVKASRGES